MSKAYDNAKYKAKTLRHKAAKAFISRRDSRKPKAAQEMLLLLTGSMMAIGVGGYQLLDERMADIDQQGTAQHEITFNAAQEQLNDLQTLSIEYSSLHDQLDDVNGITDKSLLANPDMASDIEMQIALSEYQLEKGLQEFIGTLYTKGSAEDGLDLSEQDVKDLMTQARELDIDLDALSANYEFDKLLSPRQSFAYLDEMRAHVSVDDDASISERFEAAKEIVSDATQKEQGGKSINLILALFMGVILGAGSLLWGTGKRVEGWAKTPPKKPHYPKH